MDRSSSSDHQRTNQTASEWMWLVQWSEAPANNTRRRGFHTRADAIETMDNLIDKPGLRDISLFRVRIPLWRKRHRA